MNLHPQILPYKGPTTTKGLLSQIPSSWVPYAQLMRLDRPSGLYACYFPYLIGLLYTACISPTTPAPSSLLRVAGILLPFNILIRGAACAWNDNVDQGFDRQVERCRHRPIARGAVSTAQGHIFTVALLLLGLPILALFPAPCTMHGIVIVAFSFVYALMKRITFYPQVILGIPFAWAIFFCMAAFQMDPFHFNTRSTMALVGANILWTIVYDTIYAHQDIADDEKAGVKGMAVRFREKTKLLSAILATAQVALLAMCGHWSGFGCAYQVGTVGGVAAAMAWYIHSVDLADPASCGAWFHTQFWTVGGSFILGLCGEYAVRLGGM